MTGWGWQCGGNDDNGADHTLMWQGKHHIKKQHTLEWISISDGIMALVCAVIKTLKTAEHLK